MALCYTACAYGINSDRDQIKIKSWLHSWYYAEACNESPEAQRMGYTAPKKRRSDGEPLATLCRFDRARI